MKKKSIVLTAVLLAAALLVGSGCTPSDPPVAGTDTDNDVTTTAPDKTVMGDDEDTSEGGNDIQTEPETEPMIEPTKGIDYELSLDWSFATVIRYIGTVEQVWIAKEYEGAPVTSIGDFAFEGCDSLTSVVIPDSITSIGNGAFSGCSKLMTEYESCTYVGSVDNPYHVLIGTTNSNLSAYTIHEDTKLIAYGAFSYCSSLTSVVIPDGVISIGDSAFEGCSSLTSVVIPDGVTSIGDEAFRYCSSLTSVVIPDGVTSIGDSAFEGCSKLITEYESCTYVGLDDNPYHILIGLTNPFLSAYTIHEDTKLIAGETFSGCPRLNRIAIPDGVTFIGNYAFSGCFSLTSVVIPDSVTSIGVSAFDRCDSLTSVVIGEGVTYIGHHAFSNCDLLTSVYYTGAREDWNGIYIDGDRNSDLTSAIRFYYAETDPADGGRYWRYVDGVPTPW